MGPAAGDLQQSFPWAWHDLGRVPGFLKAAGRSGDFAPL